MSLLHQNEQVQKLEALQAKQTAVLRRKTQEAEAARRRLKVTDPHSQLGALVPEKAHTRVMDSSINSVHAAFSLNTFGMRTTNQSD